MAEKVYGIGLTMALRYVEESDMEVVGFGFECEDGCADIVAQDGGCTVLLMVSCARRRSEPKVSRKRLAHIAMAYLVQHPGIDRLRIDLVNVALVAGAMAEVSHVVGAYEWER